MTPAEKWHGKKSNLDRVHLFGSKAYAKRLEYIKKLDDRTKEYVSVGYRTKSEKNNCLERCDICRKQIQWSK